MSEFTAENKPLAADFEAPAEPAAPAAPTEEQFSVSREDWEQIQQNNNWIAEQLQSIAQLAAPQEQGVKLDPFADDFRDQLDRYISERVTPYEQMRQEVILGEATERANDILGAIESEKGEFVDPSSREIALAMAERYAGEEQQRHGVGPKAAEAAIERGYQFAKERDDRIAQIAVERHLNQLKRLGDAPREPGSAGATAVQQHVLPKGGDEMSVVRHYGGYGR